MKYKHSFLISGCKYRCAGINISTLKRLILSLKSKCSVPCNTQKLMKLKMQPRVMLILTMTSVYSRHYSNHLDISLSYLLNENFNWQLLALNASNRFNKNTVLTPASCNVNFFATDGCRYCY